MKNFLIDCMKCEVVELEDLEIEVIFFFILKLGYN